MWDQIESQSRVENLFRSRLVKTNVAITTDTEQLHIETPSSSNLGLIICAKVRDLVGLKETRRYFPLFLSDVDVIKEVLAHKERIGLRILRRQPKVLIKIEGPDILKAETFFLNKILMD